MRSVGKDPTGLSSPFLTSTRTAYLSEELMMYVRHAGLLPRRATILMTSLPGPIDPQWLIRRLRSGLSDSGSEAYLEWRSTSQQEASDEAL